MPSITQTVVAALRDVGLSDYSSRARPVIDRLEARERDIADRLIEVAVEQGMDREDVWRVFSQMDFNFTPAVPDLTDSPDPGQMVGDPGMSEVLAAIKALQDDVGTLMGVARSRGLI